MLLLWLTPAVLIVPGILLSISEIDYTPWDRTVNIILPLGVYILWCAAWRKTGWAVLLLLPLMVLAAFEIVIHDLYGESIIAIDMFLNVVTTNSKEAGELLDNLLGAIGSVVLLYLPPLVLAVISLVKKQKIENSPRKAGLVTGALITAVGMITLAGSFAYDRANYAPDRKLFPVNVISNMFTSFERYNQNRMHDELSSEFRFNSVDTHSEEPEIYVLVVGETSRAGNWQLNGYARPTNPRLSHRSNLVNFTHVMTESNTTHKSVPLLLSHLGAEHFHDSINVSKSVLSCFREAGYRTAYISNQQRNGNLIDAFGQEADTVRFLTDSGNYEYDMNLCGVLGDFLNSDTVSPKKFAVLHTYGSHFNYRERFPEGYHHFTPDDATEANVGNRDELLNAYDNSIRYTDAVLDSIISTVESTGKRAVVLYVADHGEDIFDDGRERFLHASPTPTYYQLHVPMVLWMSDSYRETYPEKYEAAIANADLQVAGNRSAFHTLTDLAGLSYDRFNSSESVCSDTYTEPDRRYVNDYNEAVPLEQSGLRAADFEQLTAHGLR